MCGIVGYAGAGGRSAEDELLAGLGRLGGGAGAVGVAAGVAVAADGGLAAVWDGGGAGSAGASGGAGRGDAAGSGGGLSGLRGALGRRPVPAGTCGIGQLGGVPALDGAGRVAVVLAGGLEAGAVARLRAELRGRGHALGDSGADAEVVAHLVAEAFSSCGELVEAVRQVRGALAGEFAVLAVHADEPDTVVGAGGGPPLVVAAGDGEVRVASGAGVPGAWGGAGDGAGAGESVVLGSDQVVLVRREFDEVRWEITDGRGAVVAP
ncbi:glucosamine--fructose-6-phosphate aminotransferase [Streptomyces carpaticus]|uniref:Glutamine--fructose-6-phosphate aminotransferase [isomerizing] n=1 Tax=Streptomyces carpaticus TaxID=285558 RepID=A0ABV4ZJR3_9ACTN